MAPKYSVLLPTHNRADVVGYAIRSVLAQTDSDFELLIVGDGCTDDTASVVASFADSRIRWFDFPKAPNFGYANRNRALRQAAGDLVAFMAHDDLLLPDHLATLAGLFDDRAVEWAYSRPVWVSDDGVVVPYALDLRKASELDTFLNHHNSLPASTVVYRRSDSDRNGWWPEHLAGSGDWDMWKRMLGPSHGANLAYMPRATTLHFRAIWRSEREWGPPPLQMWLDHAHSGWWPATLRVEMPTGMLPQARFSRLLDADPVGFSESLREGIAEALDELAWRTSLDAEEVRHRLVAQAAGKAAMSESLVAAAEERAASAKERAAAAEKRSTAAERLAAAADERSAATEERAAAAEERAAAAEQDATLARLNSMDTERRAIQAEEKVLAALERAEGADAQLLTFLKGALARSGDSTGIKAIARGLALRVRGNPLFDAEWYASEYRHVDARGAYRDWLARGIEAGRDPNPLFDTRWYLARNPDVRSSGMNPLDHYYLHGGREGRSPSPQFDALWYLSMNPDVWAAGVNPLLHYVRHGRAENRPVRAVA
jgi:glycosyltransferase involved in cell wall biosynthesis